MKRGVSKRGALFIKKFFFIIIVLFLFSVVVSAKNICQCNSSATATSENFGSEAIHDTDVVEKYEKI